MIIRGRSFGVIVLLAVFGIIGCFLPWNYSPGFIEYPINGVQLSPRFEDNGGLIVIIMLLVEAMLCRCLQKKAISNGLLLIAPMIFPILITFGENNRSINLDS